MSKLLFNFGPHHENILAEMLVVADDTKKEKEEEGTISTTTTKLKSVSKSGCGAVVNTIPECQPGVDVQ